MSARLLPLLLFAVAGTLCAQTTYHVDVANVSPPFLGTATDPFPTIAMGLAAASPAGGDTVLVAPGEYVEDVHIAKPLVLQGSGSATVVKPNPAGPFYGPFMPPGSGPAVIDIAASGVTVADLRVDGTTVFDPLLTPHSNRARRGIQAVVAVNVVIQSCVVENAAFGIFMSYSANVTVAGCTVNQTGFDAENGTGIDLFFSTGNVFLNTVTASAGTGIHYRAGSSGQIGPGNAVTGCVRGIAVSGNTALATVTGNSAGGSAVADVQVHFPEGPVTVSGNIIAPSATGFLQLGGGSDLVTLTGNAITGTGGAGTVGLAFTTDGLLGFQGTTVLATGNTLQSVEIAVRVHESPSDLTRIHAIVLGGAPGSGNTFGGSIQNLVLENADDDVVATDNDWGTCNPEATITHSVDNPLLGTVNFSGYSCVPPVLAGAATLGVGAGPSAAVWLDADGDGDDDVAVACEVAGTVEVLRRGDTGELEPFLVLPAGPSPAAVIASDLDGDGDPDLAVADRSGTVHVFYGGPGFTFPETAVLAVGGTPAGIAPVLRPGRVLPDLLVADAATAGGGILIVENSAHAAPGLRGLTGAVVLGGMGAVVAVAAGDVTGDGIADLVAAGAGPLAPGVRVVDGVTLAETVFLGPSGGVPSDVALRDLDGDGRMEILAGGDSVVGGFWTHAAAGGPPVPAPVPPIRRLAAGNLDDDWRSDVALCTEDGDLCLLFGITAAGAGSFAVQALGTAAAVSLLPAPASPAPLPPSAAADLLVLEGALHRIALWRPPARAFAAVVEGSGLPGSALALSAAALPFSGSPNFQLHVAGAPPLATLVMALQIFTSPGEPVPLAVVGGAFLGVDPAAPFAAVPLASDASGSAVLPLPVPADPALLRLLVLAEAVTTGPGGAGFDLSPAVLLRIGEF